MPKQKVVSNYAARNEVPVPVIPFMFHQGMRNAANRAGLPPPLPLLPRVSKPPATKQRLTLSEKWENEAWERANNPRRRPVAFVKAKYESKVEYDRAIQRWEHNTGRKASVDETAERTQEAQMDPNRVTFARVSDGGGMHGLGGHANFGL